MMRKGVLSLISIFAFLQAVSAQETKEGEAGQERKPKLFYVTTKSTTSTITTHSICFASGTAAITACGKRKKRTIMSAEEEDIQPSVSDVEPSWDEKEMEEEMGENRGARFLVYWLTTTSTSRSTSYSTTSTVSVVGCTPSNWPISACG